MMSAAPRVIADLRPVMPLITSASSDADLKAALQAFPSLSVTKMFEAHAAYRAARQAYGHFWRALDGERNALTHAMQKHQPDPLTGGNASRNSDGWWTDRVGELRACLAAGERFSSTGPHQLGMSEAQRAALQPREAPAQQAPAGPPA